MPLETASYIADLVATNPLSTDAVGQGDDHLRLLKSTVQATFPNFGGVFARPISTPAGYTVLSTDNTAVIAIPAATGATLTHTVSLPALSSITAGFYVDVRTNSNGDVAIVVPTGGASIEGSANLTVGPHAFARCYYDGTTWRANRIPLTDDSNVLSVNGLLSVSGAVFFGSSLTVSGATKLLSTLTVVGAAVLDSTLLVNTNLTVNGDSSFSGTVYMGSALTVSAAAHLGSLSVAGAATLGGPTTISGGASLLSTLSVSGAAFFNSTVSIGGAATLAGTLSVSGGVAISTTLSVSGAAHFASTVSINGAATLGGAVTISGGATLLGVATISGAAHFKTTVSVGGAATLASTLSVSGAAHLKAAVSIGGGLTLGTTLSVSGASHFSGAISAAGAVMLYSTLGVSGAASFDDAVTISGAATLLGTANIAGGATLASTLSVSGAAHFKSQVSISATLVQLGLLNLTGGQIQFPAAMNASANANTLDDYEEGSWTPVLTFATPGDVSVTYTLQAGSYIKIGGMVTLWARVATSAFTHSTAAGDARITGLPFANGGVAFGTGDLVLASNFGNANIEDVGPLVGTSDSHMAFNGITWGVSTTSATLTVTDFPSGNNKDMIIQLSYNTLT